MPTANPHLTLSIDAARNEARRWMVVTLFLVFIVVIAISTTLVVLSKWQPEVKYVEFTHSRDNFFEVLPSKLPQEQLDLLIRKTLRNYVYQRERIDHITEAVRFKQVAKTSTQKVVLQFQESFEQRKQAFIGKSRDVEIIADIPVDQHIHQVEFKTVDKRANEQEEYSNYWVANIQYVVMPNKVKQEDALLNPFGVYVTKYALAKRKIETKGEKE